MLNTLISIPGALAMLLNGIGAPNLPTGSLGHINFVGYALIFLHP